MKSQVLSLSLTALAALLASCSSAPTCGNSHPYLTYGARPPLQAPAGVTLPKPDPAYVVPGAGTKAAATPAPAVGTAAAPCLVTPPSVLTKEDMTRSVKPVPAATPAPKGATQAPAKAATGPQPVAARGGME